MEKIGDSLKRLVGGNIKRIRKEAGYRQGQFAKMIGITSTTLSKMENGESDIKIGLLSDMAKVLNKPIHEFLFDKEAIILSKDELKKLII